MIKQVLPIHTEVFGTLQAIFRDYYIHRIASSNLVQYNMKVRSLSLFKKLEPVLYKRKGVEIFILKFIRMHFNAISCYLQDLLIDRFFLNYHRDWTKVLFEGALGNNFFIDTLTHIPSANK